MRTGYRFRILVVGCGGTGSHLVGLLSQLMMYQDSIKELILIDGDVIEPKNLRQQRFNKSEIGINKAKALSDRFSKLDIPISYVDKYITSKEDMSVLLAGGKYTDTIIISCVDNNKARKLLHEIFCDSYKFPGTYIYIDTGNGDGKVRRGQTVVGARKDEDLYFNPVAYYYPEILEDTNDEVDLTLNCDQINESIPQHISANVMSATTVFLIVNNIVSDENLDKSVFNFNADEISLIGVEV